MIGGRMRRNAGILAILIGIGLILLSILFSTGSSPKMNLLGNISHMEIVLAEGNYVSDNDSSDKGNYKSGIDLLSTGHYDGRVAVPLKFPLSVSVVLILFGTGGK
jgi:hypothetical protein